MKRRANLATAALFLALAGLAGRTEVVRAGPAAASSPSGLVTIYSKDNAPAVAKPEDLPLKAALTQFGVTWTFDKPARVGQFVNGDFYVVGPVTVVGISPKPEGGRNGSMLNLPDFAGQSEGKLGLDDRIPFGRYDGNLFRAPPIALRPGDVLISSISLESVESIRPMVPRSRSHVSKEHSPIRTAAVLTCLAAPVPADAFRPAYADRSGAIYLARNLRRDLLPQLARVGSEPNLADWERLFERPWLDIVMDEFGAPVENMPIYGAEFSRAENIASLLLAMDYAPQEKETLLVRYCQMGIDLWGLLKAGKPGWPALGGHGNGRKWPLLFTGLLLDDANMRQPRKAFPKAVFSEDLQTLFGDCWTGAKVVYAGHVGPQGLKSKAGWGAYEHLPPTQWEADIGEDYRRCCTSMNWIGDALAVQLYKAEKLWDHDAFLYYADRWMYEDDTEFIKAVKEARGKDYNTDWSRQGMVWDKFVKDLWTKYRPAIPAPTDRWKRPPPTPQEG